MNPVPIINKRNSTILLIFTAFPQELSEADLIKGEGYQQKILVTKSRDNGLTWSEPRDVTETTLGMMDPRPHIYASGESSLGLGEVESWWVFLACNICL